MKTDKCITGKKKYSKSEAKKQARFIKYHKKYPSESPVAYSCKHGCGWWHIGNSGL